MLFYMCVSACMDVCAHPVRLEPMEVRSCHIPWNWVQVVVNPLIWVLGTKPGPLQEQQLSITSESFLQPCLFFL